MKKKTKNVLVSAASALSGLLSGIFGALGGVLVMYITAWANPDKDKDALRDNYATAICVTMTVCAFSLISYAVQGNVDTSAAFRYAVPAAAGGTLGALLCDKMPVTLLRSAFSAVTIWAGARMIFGG